MDNMMRQKIIKETILECRDVGIGMLRQMENELDSYISKLMSITGEETELHDTLVLDAIVKRDSIKDIFELYIDYMRSTEKVIKYYAPVDEEADIYI